MVLKDWDDVPYGAANCCRDHTEWNDMVAYIKHSGSCNTGTGHILYDDDASTNQKFRFTYVGAISKSYGGTNAGDDRQWRANDADTYPYIEGLGGSHLKFYTGNDIYFYDNAVEEFRFYDNSIDIKGDRAIYINDDEVYVGHGAGDNIGAGTNNTLVGHDAGQANNFTNCAFFGFEAGKNNTQSSAVAVGYQALKNNTGTQNTAFGYASLPAACTGSHNTALGYNCLSVNTNGGSNVAIGDRALSDNLGGTYNVAIGGYQPLGGNTTGSSNIAIGQGALQTNTIGATNTAVGTLAGQNATNNLSGCVYLGNEAGKNNAASSCLYINNTNSAFPLIYGEFANDIVKIGNNSDDFGLIFDVNTAGIGKVYGGDDTGDDLWLYGNSTDAMPWIKVDGNSHITIRSNQSIILNATNSVEVYGARLINFSGGDAVIATLDTNGNIYLNPHGTGRVKFGVETVNAGSDRGKLIAMKTAAGTTVYLKTYDTV